MMRRLRPRGERRTSGRARKRRGACASVRETRPCGRASVRETGETPGAAGTGLVTERIECIHEAGVRRVDALTDRRLGIIAQLRLARGDAAVLQTREQVIETGRQGWRLICQTLLERGPA